MIRQVSYIADQSLARYTYFDRYVNECGIPEPACLDHRFRPKNRDLESFKLPRFRVSRDQVDLYLDNPDEDLIKEYIRDDHVVFCVHPAVVDDSTILNMNNISKRREFPLTVTPTATSRTLIVMDALSKPHFVKTHMPLQLDSHFKNLNNDVIKHGVQISSELKTITLASFAYQAESIGIATKDTEHGPGWGFVVREMIPRPFISEKTELIPVYSLFALDTFYPEERPLLCRLIDQSKEDPIDYVLDTVMEPIFACFVEGIRKLGILFQSHGQNTLLEVNTDFEPTGRIIHRDFQVAVDPKIREFLGLDLTNLGTNRVMEDKEGLPGSHIYSYTYDNCLGRHLFDHLARVLERHYGISDDRLKKRFLTVFKKHFPDFQDFFATNDVYRAAKITGPNQFGKVVVSQEPKWRPLIA